MFPKSKRLNLKTDFGWVVKGKRIETSSFKIFYSSGKNKQAKVAVSVSKKNFKSAVLRNKAKRVSFEAIERLYDQLPSNINLIMMPKASVLDKGSESLSLELKKILE